MWKNQGGREYSTYSIDLKEVPHYRTGEPADLGKMTVVNPFGQGEMEIPLHDFEKAKVLANYIAEQCGYIARWQGSRLTLIGEGEVAIALYNADALIDILYEREVRQYWVVHPSVGYRVVTPPSHWQKIALQLYADAEVQGDSILRKGDVVGGVNTIIAYHWYKAR